MEISEQISKMLSAIEEVESEQSAMVKLKRELENSIQGIEISKDISAADLDIVTNAITILRDLSDETVKESYKFIEESLNAALERIFVNSVRKIKLHEYTARGTYPQLEIKLTVEGGKERSLKSGSGHGLMQIVSLLCVISLIVITDSRKLLVMDEILSGLSAKARLIVNDILWSFTEIGFQFVVNEHGFIPKGSQVYHLEMKSAISNIKEEYIEETGLYLSYDKKDKKDKKSKENTGEDSGEYISEVMERVSVEEDAGVVSVASVVEVEDTRDREVLEEDGKVVVEI